MKDVRGLLTENRKLAYTTVMTVLDRLEKRGSVERHKEGRSFVYAPVVGREELRRLAVLVDTFFDGSEEKLLGFLGGRTERPSPARTIQVSATESIDTDLL